MKQTNQEAVFVWTIHNFDKLKKLLEPIKLQREELLADPTNKGLEKDIQKQFDGAIKSELAHEIAKNLQLNAQEVLEIVEDMNYDEFLK